MLISLTFKINQRAIQKWGRITELNKVLVKMFGLAFERLVPHVSILYSICLIRCELDRFIKLRSMDYKLSLYAMN